MRISFIYYRGERAKPAGTRGRSELISLMFYNRIYGANLALELRVDGIYGSNINVYARYTYTSNIFYMSRKAREHS